MNKRYDILQSVSQREDGALSGENEELVHIANIIAGAATDSRANEEKSRFGSDDGVTLNEQEQRRAERWAKQHDCWIPMEEIFQIGVPGPSGSESDTYVASDVYIYKTNNLMHCSGSIFLALKKFINYNNIFPDSAYTFVGFTGFDGRSVYPVVRQRYIKDGIPATQNEIDCYMSALGFTKDDVGKYHNERYAVSDVLPKNVLKDSTGDFFVIDAEIRSTLS